MTISSSQTQATYTGNGAATVFPIPFPRSRNADIAVRQTISGVTTTLVEGADYSYVDTVVDGVTIMGGDVIMAVAPATGTLLTLDRQTPLTQDVDLVSGGPLPAETIERALDKLTMIMHESDGTPMTEEQIAVAYENERALISSADARTGTNSTVESFSAARVREVAAYTDPGDLAYQFNNT